MARAHVFKRLAGDRRAVSAVEFALIAPLLILAYVSSVHLTLALSADRKLTAAAATVADLVAQNETVTSAVINDIFEAGRVLVQPFPAGDLQMRITSVRADSNGVAQLVWSEGLGMGARSPGDLPSLPAGVLLPDSGLVVVEMSYPYDTPFTGVSFGNFTFTETAFMRPRRSAFVDLDAPPGQPGQGQQTPPAGQDGSDGQGGSNDGPGSSGQGNGNGNGPGNSGNPGNSQGQGNSAGQGNSQGQGNSGNSGNSGNRGLLGWLAGWLGGG